MDIAPDGLCQTGGCDPPVPNGVEDRGAEDHQFFATYAHLQVLPAGVGGIGHSVDVSQRFQGRDGLRSGLLGDTHCSSESGGVERTRAEVNSTTVYDVAAGESGTPLLLVHGCPESWWACHKLIPLLSAHHRVAEEAALFPEAMIVATTTSDALICSGGGEHDPSI